MAEDPRRAVNHTAGVTGRIGVGVAVSFAVGVPVVVGVEVGVSVAVAGGVPVRVCVDVTVEVRVDVLVDVAVGVGVAAAVSAKQQPRTPGAVLIGSVELTVRTKGERRGCSLSRAQSTTLALPLAQVNNATWSGRDLRHRTCIRTHALAVGVDPRGDLADGCGHLHAAPLPAESLTPHLRNPL